MRGFKLELLAVVALMVGVAGCSLPEVLPVAIGTTSGPSPYGPWYEQHWTTNAVLLAASDQPEGNVPAEEDAALPADDDAAAAADAAASAADAAAAEAAHPSAVEANAAPSGKATDFDNSTPYQFPASSYSPSRSLEADDAAPASDSPASSSKGAAAVPEGSIRY